MQMRAICGRSNGHGSAFWRLASRWCGRPLRWPRKSLCALARVTRGLRQRLARAELTSTGHRRRKRSRATRWRTRAGTWTPRKRTWKRLDSVPPRKTMKTTSAAIGRPHGGHVESNVARWQSLRMCTARTLLTRCAATCTKPARHSRGQHRQPMRRWSTVPGRSARAWRACSLAVELPRLGRTGWRRSGPRRWNWPGSTWMPRSFTSKQPGAAAQRACPARGTALPRHSNLAGCRFAAKAGWAARRRLPVQPRQHTGMPWTSRAAG